MSAKNGAKNARLENAFTYLGDGFGTNTEWYETTASPVIDSVHGSGLHHDANGVTAFREDTRFASISGQGETIVIIDTGINPDHVLFGNDSNSDGVADKIVYQYDFVSNDTIAEARWDHGSNVASIAAATHPTFGGVAPDANLIVLNVGEYQRDANGDISVGVSSTALRDAISWVAENGATYDVTAVNLSIGSGNTSQYLDNAGRFPSLYNSIAAQGITMVVSSGNSFFSFGSQQGVNELSAYSNVLSVGATYAANYGGVTWGGGASNTDSDARVITPFTQRDDELTDVMATGAFWTGASGSDDTVASAQGGTSQASPAVAGAVALLQQLAERELGARLDVDTLIGLIREHGTTINDGDDENDNVVNTGLDFTHLNVLAVAEAILDLKTPPPPQNRLDLTTGTDTIDLLTPGISEADDTIYATSASVLNAADTVVLGSDFSGWDKLVLEFDPDSVNSTGPLFQGRYRSLDEIAFESVSGVTVDMTKLFGPDPDYFNEKAWGYFSSTDNRAASAKDTTPIAITLTAGDDTLFDTSRDAGVGGSRGTYVGPIIDPGDGDDDVTVNESFRVLSSRGDDDIRHPTSIGPTVDYSLDPAGITVTRSGANTIVADGYGDTDTLHDHKHKIIGTDHVDSFSSPFDPRQQWEGRDGNDSFDNSAGRQGVNNPAPDVGIFGLIVEYRSDPGGIVADMSGGVLNYTVQDGYGSTDTLLDVVSLVGSGFDDRFVLGAEDMWIAGGTGNDFFDLRSITGSDTEVYGEWGKDEFWVSNQTGLDSIYNVYAGSLSPGDVKGDMVRWFGTTLDLVEISDANDNRFLGTDFVTDLTADDAARAPGGVLTLRGTDGDNRIEGNSGINRIEGEAGADLIIGRGGNDVLFGGAGEDVFDFGAGDGFDEIADFDATSDKIVIWKENTDFSDLDIADVNGNAVIALGTGANAPDAGIVGTTGFAVQLTGISAATVDRSWFEFRIPDAALDAQNISLSGDESLGSINRAGQVASDQFGRRFVEFGDTSQTITGSAQTDQIKSGGGDDVVNGRGGDDFLLGGTGNDQLTGQAGSDALYGGADNDVLLGGAGADLHNGGEGIDRAQYTDATAGVLADLQFADRNTGFAAGDTYTSIERLYGSKHADNLRGDASANVLWGHNGNDKLYGRGGNDTLDGGDNDDLLSGGAGNDRFLGRDGDDLLRGDNGNDALFGGNGNDTMQGGAGNDSLRGGNDRDNLTGGAGIDTLLGGAGVDTLRGAGDNDIMSGNTGNDLLSGGTGNDLMRGNDGSDDLFGDSGNDSLFGQNGNDRLFGGAGNDALRGGNDNDIVEGGNGDDNVLGGAGNDIGRGDAGDDLLVGAAGNDFLFGGRGNDTISGGDGLDWIYGEQGNDIIRPGGNDRDRDITFVDRMSGDDSVAGFESGFDRINVNGSNISSADDLAGAISGRASAVIDLGGGSSLTLFGVRPEDLSASDFIF